jgi:hypothetical protein
VFKYIVNRRRLERAVRSPSWNPAGPIGDDGERNFGGRKCEANSLVVRPSEGRKLCLEAILKYIDLDGIEH